MAQNIVLNVERDREII